MGRLTFEGLGEEWEVEEGGLKEFEVVEVVGCGWSS